MPITGTSFAGHFANTGTSGAVGAGPGARLIRKGAFNVSIWGTFVATLRLERSFDGGTTWLPVTNEGGTVRSWTAPVSTSFTEEELSVMYRLNCTAWTSGVAEWRISQ